MSTQRRTILDGVLVVDLSRALAGPQAAMMLGDLGARVIKVEPPQGDDSRGWGPPYAGHEGAPQSTYFMCANRNKESVVLDLKTPAGLAACRDLIGRADVLIENYRGGVMERLGLGLVELRRENPRLIALSITGFGAEGEMAGRPGYDQIIQGEAGLMSVTGDAAGGPTKMGVPICDLLAGLYGGYGVLAALYERERTGTGTIVRTSLFAAAVAASTFQGTRFTVAGDVPGLTGNHHAAIAPYGSFRCADGLVQIAVASDRLWQAFRAYAGLAAGDPRWASPASRLTNRDALTAEIERSFAGRTRDTIVSDLLALGVPAGRIATMDEVFASPPVRDNDMVVMVDQPDVGRIGLPAPPVSFEGLPTRDHQHPPLLGEHTGDVLAWLKSSPTEMTGQ
jgi:crotonobetainyl-CoA:carnitine CoA-transferase CaiB-like acyl-CoA transferase